MDAHFEWAETGVVPPEDKSYEFIDFFLNVTDYSGPSPKNKIRYSHFADYADMKYHPVMFNRVLYLYDAESGLYFEGGEFLSSFMQHLLSLFAGESVNERFLLLLPSLKISHEADEICRQTASLHVVCGKKSPFNQFRGVPVKNGVVVFDEDGRPSLVPYSPEMLFTRKIPVEFHADASAALSLLRSWAGDSCGVLVQIAAQAFLQGFPDVAPFKLGYMFYGCRNSGKSACLEFLEGVFGHEFVSHIPLHQLSERFNESCLDGKFLNAGDDLSCEFLPDTGAFKRLSGKAWHDTEPKGRARYQVRLSAVYVFSCNRLPRVSRDAAADDAFWDRWAVVPFSGCFEKDGTWFSSVGREVYEGYLRLAVEMMSAVFRNEGGLLFSPGADEARRVWMEANSPVACFLSRFTDRNPDGFISKGELLSAIVPWGEAHAGEFSERVPSNLIELSRVLSRLGVSADYRKRNQVRFAVYRGISWKKGVSFPEAGMIVMEGVQMSRKLVCSLLYAFRYRYLPVTLSLLAFYILLYL